LEEQVLVELLKSGHLINEEKRSAWFTKDFSFFFVNYIRHKAMPKLKGM